MKKVILLSMLFVSFGHTTTIEKYMKATDNGMSSYLEKEMHSEAMACSKGDTMSCISLGVGSFADSAWRAREFLSFFTASGVVKKNAKKQLKNQAKKTYRAVKSKKKRAKKKRAKKLTKSQIIRKVTVSGRENLNKTGIYRIVFKDGSVYIGKAVRQTIERRLKNRSKRWLLSIKSIKAKYFPKDEVDRVERSIIGGATRFESVRYNPYKIKNNRNQSIDYRNDKFNREKHPKTRSKYYWEQ